MNTKEAIQAMLDGKKVRCLDWDSHNYVYYAENLGFVFNDDDTPFDIKESIGLEFKIYEEPKPKEKVIIEKWLIRSKFDFSFQNIVETDKIDNLCYCCNCEKVKMLETYEV